MSLNTGRFIAPVALFCAISFGACTTGSDQGSGQFDDGCERNSSAGTITVVTGFSFAASPGILDPIVAEAEGYYHALCLDVEIQPGNAPSNHALVAAGKAQFSNAGSFGEVVKANVSGEAGLVALLHYGKTPIEAIVVKADSDIADLRDLEGKLVGIKGDLPFSLQTMIARAGLERSSFDELLLETFDPVAGFDLGIDALPVYKSNEPIQLDNAGFEYKMFDPTNFDVPGSFGMLVANEDFLADHPEVVKDFTLATLKAMAFSLEQPDKAVQHALDLLAATEGAFLGEATEIPRWQIESELVQALTPEGEGVGQIDLDRLEAEIKALTEAGIFDSEPDWRSMVDADIAADLYDSSATLNWQPYR